jgi:hypothetical protein
MQVPSHVGSDAKRSPRVMPRPSATSSMGAARLLSGIAVLLIAAASTAGLWIDGLYSDPEPVVAMFRGYDLIALVVVAPVLALSLVSSSRGSVRAQLLWIGMLGSVVYTYAIYVFGTAFNSGFLLHVAVFTVSAYALIFAVVNLDMTAIGWQFRTRTPTRSVAVIMLLLAVSLGGMWVFSSLRFAITGRLPEEGSRLVETVGITHLGFVLDLSLLVPAYALAAVLLWRGVRSGYVLATVLLVSGIVPQFGYMTALVFQARANVPGATAFDPAEPIIAMVYLVAAAVMLVNAARVDAIAPAAPSLTQRDVWTR